METETDTSSRPGGRLLKAGVMGTIVAAICCFTPVLVPLFGAIGLGAAVVWLDFILLPILAIFMAITLHAILERRKSNGR